jgi:monoamine oxidase
MQDSSNDSINTNKVVDMINKLVESSDLENPAQGSDAELLDSKTLHEFMREQAGDKGIALANVVTQGLLGVQAEELSALYMIDYIKSGTGFANMGSDEKDGGQYLQNRQGKYPKYFEKT